MIRFAPTVRVKFFNRQIAEVLELASQWALLALVDVDINSIDDSRHGSATLHGHSLAVDLDPVTDRPDHTRDLALFLMRRLPAPWQVVLEHDHVHVEWDTGRRLI